MILMMIMLMATISMGMRLTIKGKAADPAASIQARSVISAVLHLNQNVGCDLFNAMGLVSVRRGEVTAEFENSDIDELFQIRYLG